MQRLDQINAKKPAKLLDSKALTLPFSCKQNLAGFFSLLSATDSLRRQYYNRGERDLRVTWQGTGILGSGASHDSGLTTAFAGGFGVDRELMGSYLKGPTDPSGPLSGRRILSVIGAPWRGTEKNDADCLMFV